MAVQCSEWDSIAKWLASCCLGHMEVVLVGLMKVGNVMGLDGSGCVIGDGDGWL